MEPIMGVFAGYALDKTSVPEDQLQPYIQEAIDQIHFAVSNASANDAGMSRLNSQSGEPSSNCRSRPPRLPWSPRAIQYSVHRDWQRGETLLSQVHEEDAE